MYFNHGAFSEYKVWSLPVNFSPFAFKVNKYTLAEDIFVSTIVPAGYDQAGYDMSIHHMSTIVRSSYYTSTLNK